MKPEVIRQIILDRVRLSTQALVDPDNLDLQVELDALANELRINLEVTLVAHRGHDKHQKIESIALPRTWVDAVKLRFVPVWLQLRLPKLFGVKYIHVERVRRVQEVYHFFPHVKTVEELGRTIWLLEYDRND